jgi:hypothetical protein
MVNPLKPRPFGPACDGCEIDLGESCQGCILNQLALSILKEAESARESIISARMEFHNLVAESYAVYEEL